MMFQQEIIVEVLRSPEQTLRLTLIPRKGWGGRGLLGYVQMIFPFASRTYAVLQMPHCSAFMSVAMT